MSDFTFQQAATRIKKFFQDRDWGQYHNPKDLTLKLMEEVGELAEQFEWQSHDEIKQAMKDSNRKQAVEEELVDVLIVLMTMMDVLDVDLEQAFNHKFKKNEAKYPVSKSTKSKVLEKKGL
jgi:NTP pyrophosphatase (non-canonical NTP hydrolase)